MGEGRPAPVGLFTRDRRSVRPLGPRRRSAVRPRDQPADNRHHLPELQLPPRRLPDASGRPPAVVTSFRIWQPLAPGKMELWNWQFVYECQSDQEKLDSYVTGQ